MLKILSFRTLFASFCFRTLFASFCLFFLVFLLLPQKTFAALYINEFSSDTAGTGTDQDWVEIYNSEPDSIDLSLYRLRDNTATNKKNLQGTLLSGEFAVFDWFNNLNKSGDVIKLLLISDELTPIDQVGYGNVGSDVTAPSKSQSAGRQSDGGTTWVIFSSPSKGSSNNTSSPAPTPTLQASPSGQAPQPTIEASPIPKPTPSKTVVASENNLLKILIGLGILIITTSAVLAFRFYKRHE